MANARSAPAKKRKPTARTSMDFILLLNIIVLLLFGLIMLFSASSPAALSGGNVYGTILKQLVFAAVGVVGMLVTSNLDYHIYQKYARTIFWGMVLVMFIVPLIGFASHGATRQISLGPVSLQPSELMKFALVIAFAARLSNPKTADLRLKKSWKEGLIPYLIMVGCIVLSCILQSHMSAALVLMAVAVLMLIVAGLDLRLLVGVGVAGVLLCIPLIILEPYRFDRFRALFNPEDYRLGIGWQIIQSLYAVGSGGLFGLGLGQSRQKYLYLPEAQNDYIFAIVCEELGFLGAVLVLALFAVFIWRGLTIALHAKDKFGRLLAFGITCIIGLQVLINVGVVLSVLPSTGMQLPLFSSGGSSLIVTLTGLGILLNVSRSSAIKKL